MLSAFLRFAVAVVLVHCQTERKWSIEHLQKLNFSSSESGNFYGLRRSALLAQSGVDFYAIEPEIRLPNIDVEFFIDEHGVPQCRYRKFSFEDVDALGDDQNSLEKKMADNDAGLKRRGDVKCADRVCNKQMLSRSLMLPADGTYNAPMDQPRCIYDFYAVAEVSQEYELLRYCAKAYFFRGLDHNAPARVAFREDWTLFLIEGRVQCAINPDNVEQGRDHLSMGYSIQIAQMSGWNEQECGRLGASLSEYRSTEKNGYFALAAIIGSAKLDNHKRDFWKRQQKCRERYFRDMRDKDGKYLVYLLVYHRCTNLNDFQLLRFDLSFDPGAANNRLVEQTGVSIELFSRKLHFSGKHSLDAMHLDETVPNK